MGCVKCGDIVRSNKSRKSNEDFINDCILVHNNKYDYSKTNYISLRDVITIICPIHGEFTQKASNHFCGKTGCKKCYDDKHNITLEKFIERSNEYHNFFYDYSFVKIEHVLKHIKIICPKHGEFLQKPSHHLKGHGCKKCKISNGERTIINLLDKYNIDYKHEYKFNDCISNKNYKLRFDFYLPLYNLCIEFDGKQHFEVCNLFGQESYDNIQINDKIKNDYCINKSIKLLRIKYDNKDIELTILNKLNENN